MEADVKNTESDNIIRLKKDDILRLKIVDSEGKDTGETLEFDMQDIDLLPRLQEMVEIDKKNRQETRNKLKILEKKQDHKGKKMLTYKQEEEIKILKEFYIKEIEVYNMFLGENGVQKILNGRKMSWDILSEIDEIIGTVILPKLDLRVETINKKIIEKYGTKKEEKNVIE